MRQGEIWVHDKLAGILTENDTFNYSPDYLKLENASPVSLTLPLQKEPYHSENMFPFFDGLIPEGWLLDITYKNWKINPRDRMGLLLTSLKIQRNWH